MLSKRFHIKQGISLDLYSWLCNVQHERKYNQSVPDDGRVHENLSNTCIFLHLYFSSGKKWIIFTFPIILTITIYIRQTSKDCVMFKVFDGGRASLLASCD